MHQIEEDKSHLNEEIQSLQHEKKNLLIQLQLLQNRLTSDEPSKEIIMEDSIQLNSTRQLPQVYRRAFERHLLLSHTHEDRQDDDGELNTDQEEKTLEDVIQELNRLSLDHQYVFDLIVRMVSKMNSYLSGSKKLVSVRRTTPRRSLLALPRIWYPWLSTRLFYIRKALIVTIYWRSYSISTKSLRTSNGKCYSMLVSVLPNRVVHYACMQSYFPNVGKTSIINSMSDAAWSLKRAVF